MRTWRVADALTMWSFTGKQPYGVNYEITMEMLEGFVSGECSKSKLKELFPKIQMALTEIHCESNKDVRRISEIEKFFISELGGYTFERMDTSCCSRRMADEATFFVDVVRASMGFEGCGVLTKTGAEKILRAWNLFPGVDSTVRIDQKAFCDWLAELRGLTNENESLRKNCEKWIGEVLCCLPEPDAGMFSLGCIWTLVNGEAGAVIRRAYQKRLMDSSSLMHLLSGDLRGESYLDRYRRYAKEASDCGYGYVSLLYRRVQSHLENLPRLK